MADNRTSVPTSLTSSAAAVPAPSTLHCPEDDIYWAAKASTRCWYCGMPGVPGVRPQLNSQHGHPVAV